MKKIMLCIAIGVLLIACGDQQINPDEQAECTEAIKVDGLPRFVLQSFYIDDYGYLCCVIAVKDLHSSADQKAWSIYGDACQPPIKGVKIINPTDGNILGKYKKE